MQNVPFNPTFHNAFLNAGYRYDRCAAQYYPGETMDLDHIEQAYDCYESPDGVYYVPQNEAHTAFLEPTDLYRDALHAMSDQLPGDKNLPIIGLLCGMWHASLHEKMRCFE